MPSDYPDDEEPTKPDGTQHEGARLLRNWAACDPKDRRLLSELALRLRRPPQDTGKR